jgi:cytochrome c553
MTEAISANEIRRRVGTELSEADVAALADWYTALAQAVGRFPADDLQTAEPPLRSTPGPRVSDPTPTAGPRT